MDEYTKNIIEANITSDEFDDLFAGEVNIDEYLTKFTKQSERYKHLSDLASFREKYELSDYFYKKSGFPNMIDFCD